MMCETVFLSLPILQVKQGGEGTLQHLCHIYVCVYLFVCWVGRSHRYLKRGQGVGGSVGAQRPLEFFRKFIQIWNFNRPFMYDIYNGRYFVRSIVLKLNKQQAFAFLLLV